MKILDAHIHLGWDYVFDEGQTEEEIVALFDRLGVSGGIVQPFIERPYMDRMANVHDRIKAMCDRYPGRFWGMVSLNPHMDPDDYDKEAKRCINELGFVAIKISQIGRASCRERVYVLV
jgi:predicted TIM-barrel fold metal-dependent hydrolase